MRHHLSMVLRFCRAGVPVVTEPPHRETRETLQDLSARFIKNL